MRKSGTRYPTQQARTESSADSTIYIAAAGTENSSKAIFTPHSFGETVHKYGRTRYLYWKNIGIIQLPRLNRDVIIYNCICHQMKCHGIKDSGARISITRWNFACVCEMKLVLRRVPTILKKLTRGHEILCNWTHVNFEWASLWGSKSRRIRICLLFFGRNLKDVKIF